MKEITKPNSRPHHKKGKSLRITFIVSILILVLSILFIFWNQFQYSYPKKLKSPTVEQKDRGDHGGGSAAAGAAAAAAGGAAGLSTASSVGVMLPYIISLISLIGVISTAILGWRRDKREVRRAEIENERLKLELEKLKVELKTMGSHLNH